MAYKYKLDGNCWTSINASTNSAKDIEFANNLVRQLELDCSKYTTLLKLAEKNKFEVIVKNISYSIPLKIAEGVRSYLSENKSEDDEGNYRYVNNLISDLLGVKIKIDKVMLYGYEGYAYQFEFDYLGTRYGLIVPMIENLTQENYKHASEGMMAIAIIGDTSISYLASSYEEEDIRVAFQNKINKKESK